MHRARSVTTIAAALTLSQSLFAAASPLPEEPATALSTQSRGRPTVVLDHLELPDVQDAKAYERHLRQVLRREVRRADWGAGSGHRIEYRFFVNELSLSMEGGVLRVRCLATGRLPKGKSAKSQLTYGGDPRERRKVVFRVLEIVARGVVTRLAELERARRAQSR